MSSLSTDFLKINKNISFYKNLQSSGEFYIFTGKPTVWDVNELIPGFVIPSPSINALALKNETKDIIAMKKIKSSDVSLAIKRYNWVQGTVYDTYDVYDDNLLRKQFYSGTKPFYVMTSEYNVYKCLGNNHGSPSIEQPSGQFLAPVVLSDNYKWKFMFNVSEEDRVKFLSSSYIPLKGNFELPSTSAQYRMSSSAIAGTIETIDVSSPGANYNQGTSEISFAGDGSGLAATITITSGGLTNVSVTNPGSGYNTCSVSVIDNDSTYSPAVVKPQFSPPGGHGFNCSNELGAFYTIVSVDLLGSEDAIFPLNAYFRKTGILTEFKDINGTFTSQDFYYGPAHPYYNNSSLRTSNPTKFLKDYSGQILYINYHEPVQRKATQLERIKLIIETN